MDVELSRRKFVTNHSVTAFSALNATGPETEAVGYSMLGLVRSQG
jgi:hypothetical protein